MFYIIGMIIVGLVAGALARLILPGKDPMGLMMTAVLGIIGSFVGGIIGTLLHMRNEDKGYFVHGGFLLSILGAILVLWIWRMIRSRTA